MTPEYHRDWQRRNPTKRAEYASRYRRKNRAKHLAYQRTWTNRTRAAARAMLLARQGGKCAICKTTKPGGEGVWHKDHCHREKRVRGVLCSNCNWGLGHFKDNPALLRTAARYLEKRHEPS